jgi:hypothetical protein
VRRRDVQQVQAAGKVLRCAESREFTRLGEHLIRIERRPHQPIVLDVVAQLLPYRTALGLHLHGRRRRGVARCRSDQRRHPERVTGPATSTD